MYRKILRWAKYTCPIRCQAIMSETRSLIEAIVFDLDDPLWPIAPTIVRAEPAI